MRRLEQAREQARALAQAGGWSPRSVIRWGDSQQLIVQAGVLALESRQLVMVQAPSPCIWRVHVSIAGFDAADAVTFRFLLDIGCGSMTARSRSDAFGTPGGIQTVEAGAQSIMGRVELASAAVVAARDVTVSMWAAPVVPFDGICVGVNCDGE